MAGILLILAHPDDETLFAGTVAKYADAGVHVGLVCGTRGERGSTSDVCSIEELPRVREAEVRESGRILGIQEVEMLPYEDQKLWAAPLDEVRRLLVAALRRQRPEIVVTFDPNGANQHTDHISISRFVTDAVSAAADPRWYPGGGPPHTTGRVLWQTPVPPFALGKTENLEQHPGIDFLINVEAFRDRKEDALRAHRTQYAGIGKLFRAEGALIWEGFRVGWGQRPRRVPDSDLFAA